MVRPLVLEKGARVGFQHGELGWIEWTVVRPSTTGEEWLVRTTLGDRWVALHELRPPRRAAATPAIPGGAPGR